MYCKENTTKKAGRDLRMKGKLVREGFKKSKWKFKMAFAMKGGGLEGVSSAIYLF